jgi:hypothetical protein
MDELKLLVPTYYGAANCETERFPGKEEFDEPNVPMLIREAEGVRVVLGSHDFEDLSKPDVQIERRPNGWAIFLHPVPGGDPSGLVYFLDDGRSFLVPDGLVSEGIVVLDRADEVPMIDDPPPPQATLSLNPALPEALAKALAQANAALAGDSNDDEHDALLTLVDALEECQRIAIGDSTADPPMPVIARASSETPR